MSDDVGDMRGHGSFLSADRRRTAVGVLVSLLLMLVPAAGAAAETAEALYSRGLVQFNNRNYAEALTLFDQAVAADAADPYARYYRGVTYIQLERAPEAVADLRAALSSRPDMAQAHLELGVALVEAGEFADAIPHLERAQQDLPEQAPRAALFLGLAHLRLEQTEAARSAFARAAADPELVATARYYQGVLDYLAQRWTEAQTHFEYVVAAKEGTAIAAESRRFLDRLESRRSIPINLYATVGLEYDSNVAIVPLDDAAQVRQGVDDEGDGRVIIGAGGVYVPWHNDWAQLSVGYDFFQSLQFDLTKFDLQNHRPSVQLAGQRGAFSFGTFARYDYYLLGSRRKFLQQGTAVPFVSYDSRDFGRTELFFRARRRDFLRAPYNDTLDSWNYGPGLRQVIDLGSPQRNAWIGYRFDHEDTLSSPGDGFAYDGHEVSVGTSWVIMEDYSADITYAFRHEDYASASGGRTDYVHLPIAAFQWNINDHFALTLAYLGTFNDSNQEDFEYNRHIASLSVTVRN